MDLGNTNHVYMKINMPKLTFIIAVNLRNYPFVLPFAYFAAKYNSKCIIDMHLYSDCDISHISNGIEFLH